MIWTQTKTLTTTNHSKISIIITAAGSSTRMGSGIKKEYLPLQNGTVLSSCAKNFLNAINGFYSLADFVITYPFGGIAASKKAISDDAELTELIRKSDVKIDFVQGNSTRQSSVFNALNFLNEKGSNPDIVLIHDGARPFVSTKIIQNVINASIEYGASVPGLTPTDTQKEIDENGFITRHLERKNLAAVQTPQGFEFSKLFKAHQKAKEDNREYTDDTEIWGKYVGQVKVVEGDSKNKKITYPEDLNF